MRKVCVFLAAAMVLCMFPRTSSADESWAVIEVPDDIQITAFFNDTIYARSAEQSRLYVVEGDNLDQFTELKTSGGHSLQLFEHNASVFAHMPHVLLDGGVLAQATGGFYLLKGSTVTQLCNEDGSAVKGYPSRHPFGTSECPYLCLGRDLLHIKDGIATKVNLPKEIVVPQVAQVGDTTILAASNKYWSLKDGQVTPLMDDEGEPFAAFTSLNMRGVGQYLLIYGVTPGDTAQHFELYHVEGGALKHVRLPEGEALGHCEMVGERIVLTIGKSDSWRAMEPDGEKLKQIAALKKLELEKRSIASVGTYAVLSTGDSSRRKFYIYDGKKLTTCKLPEGVSGVACVPFMRPGDRVVAQFRVSTESSSQCEARWYSLGINGKATELLSSNLPGGGKFWYDRVSCMSYGVYALRVTPGDKGGGYGDRKHEVIFKKFGTDASKD